VKCRGCATEVEYSARGVLVDMDGSGMRKHFCPPEAISCEQWDIHTCGQRYVRIDGGELLNWITLEPHVCAAPEPTPPTPPANGHISVEPPLHGVVVNRETKYL
jgi:hypothetical protein